jgi:RNA polymerase sigma-70 factor (ECF subfamily)
MDTMVGELGETVRLVLAAKDGDRRSLDELFARHAHRAIRSAALRMGRALDDFEDYEDIAQDALLRAFRGLDGFDPSKGRTMGSFRSWLARCVETAFKDHMRRKNAEKRAEGIRFADLRREDLSTVIFEGKEPTPSKIAAGKEADRMVEQALLRLPPRYRSVIILRKVDGMEFDEIARELGFGSEESVRLVLSRALKKLRKELGLGD